MPSIGKRTEYENHLLIESSPRGTDSYGRSCEGGGYLALIRRVQGRSLSQIDQRFPLLQFKVRTQIMTTGSIKIQDPATSQETPDRRSDDLNAAVSRYLRNGHHANGLGPCRGAAEVHDEEPEPRFRLDLPLRPEHEFEGIIGCCSSLRQVVEHVKMVAPTNSTVLLLGETGTGKELVARAVHNLSARREGPWITVNCAAIPSGLLESELFGSERGAFTGALTRKIGRFEMANGGTLFLDEIGDMPPELQPKLLRVLQEREFERLGSVQTLRADVRVVAATSRHLPEMVASGKFRSDLYYRLNVFPIRLPALRERVEDIQLLVMHFVQACAKRMHKSIEQIPAETLHRLLSYSWPGNIRELQNFIERAVILTPGKVLRAPVRELESPPNKSGTAAQSVTKRALTLKDAERELIIQALAETNWVVGGFKGAASRLGLKRTTLISKMRRMGLSRALVKTLPL